jgi:hypothetical protein
MRRPLVLLACLFLASTALAANADLYGRFQGKSAKTYLEVKDSTHGKVSPEELRAKLLKGLEERKSIRFQGSETPEGADLRITAEVLDYHWTDHDPIDMLVGVGGTAMDAAVIEDFARITVDVTVCDSAGKQCWRDKLSASVTKKPMSQAESVPLVTDKFVKVFVRELFGKKNR